MRADTSGNPLVKTPQVVNQVNWLGDKCYPELAPVRSDPVLWGESDSDFSVLVLNVVGHYF